MPKLALWWLPRRCDIPSIGARVTLTDAGSRRVRSHRLWERYLSKHLALPADHPHEPAERMEHYTSQPLEDVIAREVHPPDREP